MPDVRTLQDNPDIAFETSDFDVRQVARVAVAIAAFLVAVPLLLSWLYPWAIHDAAKGPTILAPEPRQQVDPPADLLSYRAEKAALLNGYGWVDRDKGVVRIPIDEAMKRVAAQGIPDWPGQGLAAAGGRKAP